MGTYGYLCEMSTDPSKNNQLNNYELYQEFYRLNSSLTCEFVKVIGHQPSANKDEIDKLFALVDQASRRSMRKDFQRMNEINY